jgi:hypothetical protein
MTQNEIPNLGKLETFQMENIFNVYKNENGEYFYNLSNTLLFPDIPAEELYDTFIVKNNTTPYTYISYQVYKTSQLWWLICCFNNINNPVEFPKSGVQLKILKPEFVREVLEKVG